MSSSSNAANSKLSSLLPAALAGQDPYEILGVITDASTTTDVDDATISKAYRKLALKLHPDKQKATSDPKELEAIAAQFQLIKEAKNFLLQQPTERAKYDAQRISLLRRKQQEEAREASMTAQRKRMRTDLQRKEQEAAAQKREKNKASSSQHLPKSRLDELRKEGKRCRQEYEEQQQQEQQDREDERMESKKRRRKRDVEERQVRLKWSRKKWTGPSPSEHTLAQLLEPFGNVERVEMIGSKGNQALATFRSVSSVGPCVDHYRESEVMRAHYVGERKKRMQREPSDDIHDEQNSARSSPPNLRNDVGTESLRDRTLRQAAERQRMMKQMMEDDGVGVGHSGPSGLKRGMNADTTIQTSYPIAWDASLGDSSFKSPLDKLQEMERRVFGRIVDI